MRVKEAFDMLAKALPNHDIEVSLRCKAYTFNNPSEAEPHYYVCVHADGQKQAWRDYVGMDLPALVATAIAGQRPGEVPEIDEELVSVDDIKNAHLLR